MAKAKDKTRYPNTGKWKSIFLASLKSTLNVSRAADVAGITRRAAYKARTEHADFAADWDEALEEVVDRIEAISMHQALDPDPKNTVMRIFMLKSRRPEVYKETVQNELVGKDGGDMVVKVLRGVSVDDL